MSIEVKEVISERDIKAFVMFPFKHYKGNTYWVPPLIKSELASLKPSSNPAFSYCEVKMWLAYADGKIAGRIAAIINHDYNRKTGISYGRISRMEFTDDERVSTVLFNTACEWLKSEGMSTVHGPLGFSNLDVQGLLIEGHNYLPSLGSVYHYPYYQKHWENYGFEKEADWVEFRIQVEEIPEKAKRVTALVKERYKLRTVRFKSRKELKEYGRRIFKVFNESFAELPYVTHMNEEMTDFYIKKYLSSLHPAYSFAIEDSDGRLLAFAICSPNISEALQKAGGKLFPFGLLHILKAMKKGETSDLLLLGVIPEYQRLGLTAIFMQEAHSHLLNNGKKHLETTGIFETNLKAIEHWKNYKNIQHKRRRCFRKVL